MEPKKVKQFWQELTRRRVFRGIAIYGASTLVILESAEIICSAVGIERVPVWLLFVLGVGFLMSLWFSWIFDVTPGGIKRTESKSEAQLSFISNELKTYKATTYISLVIIIGLLLFNIIDGVNTKKIKDLEKSIAVLPYNGRIPVQFEPMVLDFIGNELVSGLSRIDTFEVKPWTYTENYRRGNKTYSKIGKDLGAAILIDWKAVEIEDDRILTLSLITASDERTRWTNNYRINERWSEVSSIKPEIAKDISRKLKTFLTEEEKANINKVPLSVEASLYNFKADRTAQSVMRLYEMGRRKTDLSAFDEACDFYTDAIKLDSGFAEAYANRGKTISWGIYTGYYDKSYLERCRSDIEEAFKLEEGLPAANIALGFYYYYGLKDHREALKYFEIARDSVPENVDCLFYLSLIHRRLGNWDKVAALNSKVLESKIVSSLYLTNIGISYDYLHDFPKAIECQDRAIQMQPEWEAPYQNKAESILLFNGDIERAKNKLLETVKLPENNYYFNLARLNIFEGRYKLAMRNIDLAFPDNQELEGPVLLLKAKTYNLAGYTERSMELYRLAREYYINEIRYNPDDSETCSKLGIAYAGLGNRVLAIEWGLKGSDMTSIYDDAMEGPNRLFDLARIYAMTGKDDMCVDLISKLAETRSFFSMQIVNVDPDFERIRTNSKILDLISKPY